MKRSSRVPAAFLIATAATLLAGCSGPTEVERCVDDYGNVLPDAACEPGYMGSGGYVGGGGYYHGGGGLVVVPHYVYGGEVSGGRVVGGSRSPSSNAHVTNASGRSISRAGFGGSSSHGSFGRSGGFGRGGGFGG